MYLTSISYVLSLQELAQNECQQSWIADRHAIGMTQAEMSLKEVASELHVSLRSVEC